MDLKNKKITIVGLQKTGVALAEFLSKRGASVIVTDRAEESRLGDSPSKIKKLGIALETGGHTDASFEGRDYIVLSPGVPHNLPQLKKAGNAGIPVIGEIEIASKFIKCPIIAVTGTNGKTTATTLAGEMLEKSGFTVFVGGNIGVPLVSCLDLPEEPDFVVAEISSFHLDTCRTFKPKAAALLNITEDHLDRYPGMNEYADSKMMIFRNQDENDYAVLNAADEMTMSRLSGLRAATHFFNKKNPSGNSAFMEGTTLFLQSALKGKISISTDKFRLKGTHNLENLAAAALVTWLAGATCEGIQETVNNFTGLAHRIEHCGDTGSVSFYDDSKATNIDAAIRAVEGFDMPVAVIMGGRDKGATFEIMTDVLKRHAVKAILIGEAAGKIAAAFKGTVDVEFADSMEDAARKAYASVSDTGGVVLLSPACASFDMFDDYAHRGRVFQEAARRIIMEKRGDER